MMLYSWDYGLSNEFYKILAQSMYSGYVLCINSEYSSSYSPKFFAANKQRSDHLIYDEINTYIPVSAIADRTKLATIHVLL